MRLIIIAQLAISILLTISILLQNRGSGLSATFGGDFGGYHTKRGIENFLFYSSITLSVSFIILAIVSAGMI